VDQTADAKYMEALTKTMNSVFRKK
jgi:hypothetical protein